MGEKNRWACVVVFEPPRGQLIVNCYGYPTRNEAMRHRRWVNRDFKEQKPKGKLLAVRVRPIIDDEFLAELNRDAPVADEPHPCYLCGTWKCLDCGAKRYRANRFCGQPQDCPKCHSLNGEMLPLSHYEQRRMGDHEEYQRLIAQGEVPRYPL